MTHTADATAAALISACEASPGDATPMLVLADHLHESGNYRLEFAYRWCAARGKRPLQPRRDVVWWTWHFAPYPLSGDRSSQLPDALEHHPSLNQGRHKHTRHDSFALAMECLADGLAELQSVLSLDPQP